MFSSLDAMFSKRYISEESITFPEEPTPREFAKEIEKKKKVDSARKASIKKEAPAKMPELKREASKANKLLDKRLENEIMQRQKWDKQAIEEQLKKIGEREDKKNKIYFFHETSDLVKAEHIFLNNFFYSQFSFNNKTYNSVEHYYQVY